MAINVGDSSIKDIYLGDKRIKRAYFEDILVYGNDPQTEIVDSYNYFVFNTSKVSYTNKIILANNRAGDTTVWSGLTNWGDSKVNDYKSHTYDNDGVYTVKTKYILSDNTDLNTCKMLIECKNINKNMTSYANLFKACENLTYVNTTDLNTSKVTNMYGMFNGCSSLTSLDLSSFNTSKVTNMASMFSGCSCLTSLDLSSFDTSKVTDMSSMFSGCQYLTSLDLSNWNMDNVTSSFDMFMGCYNLTIDNIIMTNCNDATKAKIQEALAAR